MDKNTGIPYEEMIQFIYQQIVNCDSVETIQVQQNINLVGKTTTHQIDVYWTFVFGGVSYYTVIQAKDWQTKVPKGAMLTFKAVLDDLPSGTKGIFITKTGYQKGAVEVAVANGISLFTFRPPTEDDWAGKMRNIIISIHIKSPIYNNLKLTLPSEYKAISGKGGVFDSKSIILNAETGASTSVGDLILSLCDECGEPPIEHTKKFNDAYLQVYQTEEKIPIVSISGLFGYQTSIEELRINGDDKIGYILQDILNGNSATFDKNALLIKNKE